MIGQHVAATLWKVSYSYEAPRTEETQRFVTGDTLILTADPAGDDLRQVVERFVMGAKPAPGYSKFLLTSIHRIQDVVGLGQFVEPDRGWPSNLATSALILETLSAGANHQAEASELAKRLEVAQSETATLMAENEGLYRIAKLAWALRTTADPDLPAALDEALDFLAKVAMPARFERLSARVQEPAT